MILHHKAVIGNRARLAVILTSSFCYSGKSPLFCLVCICLALLVVAFFAIEIYLFLSFNHFLKVFQGQSCLSSHSCRSSGLINSTPSESHCKISLAFNKGVLKTFVLLFGICRTEERQRPSFTRTSSTDFSGWSTTRINWASPKKNHPSLALVSPLSLGRFQNFVFQFFKIPLLQSKNGLTPKIPHPPPC